MERKKEIHNLGLKKSRKRRPKIEPFDKDYRESFCNRIKDKIAMLTIYIYQIKSKIDNYYNKDE